MERNAGALAAALGYLALGHLFAILLALLPFALLAMLVAWRWHIQIGASLLVIGFGMTRLLWRRHPRLLARIPPMRLASWSFVIAIAHGAGLMLAPIYLGLCRSGAAGGNHFAALAMIDPNLGIAVLVSATHTLAVFAAGAAMAWTVYRYLGLHYVARSWFNLDVVWAASLILVGALSLAGSALLPP
jgi:hypothetical protein